MTEHRGVELLLAVLGLTPLEEHHGVGAVRDRLQALDADLARRLGHVHVAPAGRTGRGFQQQPRLPALERAHEAVVEGRADMRGRVGGLGVGVIGHDVFDSGEVPVVQVAEHAHEVRGHRDVGCDLAQHVDLDLKSSSRASDEKRSKSSSLVGVEPGPGAFFGVSMCSTTCSADPTRSRPTPRSARRGRRSGPAASDGSAVPTRGTSSARCDRRTRWRCATWRDRDALRTVLPSPGSSARRSHARSATTGSRSDGIRTQAVTVGIPRCHLGMSAQQPRRRGRGRCGRGRSRCPPSRAASMMRSSHASRRRRAPVPAGGQLKIGRLTMFTPASRIRRMSSCQVSSDHWSGL